MVVKSNNMEKQVRSELKGGKGDIHFLNCVSKDTIPNCRLLSYMTIPPESLVTTAIFQNSIQHCLLLLRGRNLRARFTRVLQYCHFDNFVLLTSSRLDGDYVPIPT